MANLIPEDTIRNEALKELSSTNNGRLTTTQLIARLTERLKPEGRDADILEGRGDTYFSQKVRNLVSHRNQATGLVARGLADYDDTTEGWTITAQGRDYVADMARQNQLL